MKFRDYTFLALGSNLGNRQENLTNAVKELRQKCMVVKKSRIYESKPLMGLNQANYLNMVVMVKEDFIAFDLLHFIKGVESGLGRSKQAVWSARQIDIDIIFKKDFQLETRDLTIPHMSYNDRDFVLRPMADIAPDFIPVGSSCSINDMLAACSSKNIVGEV